MARLRFCERGGPFFVLRRVMPDPRLFIILDAINRTQGAFATAERDTQSLGKRIQATTLLVRSFWATAVAAGAASVVKAAADFESAFTGVEKTVNATAEELGALRQGFRDMAREIPVSANELANIGAIAGKLGIQADNILGFTKTIAQLAKTTNLSAPQAAQQLAQFANITGLAQEDIDRLGSTIVDLGNNLATTEQDIVNFALRIAGAGEIAGLREADILAIGGAISSLGIEAEAGGTAVQRVLIEMTNAVATGNENLALFARVAGVSAEEFARMWQEDAAGAFALFVEGLGKQGDQAFGTLEKLGLQDARLTRTFTSLAQSGDLLRRSLELGSKAFEENTALTTEAEKRYDDFNQQLELLKSEIREVAISVGEELLPELKTLVQELRPLISALGEVAVKLTQIAEIAIKFDPMLRRLEFMLKLWADLKGKVDNAFGATERLNAVFEAEEQTLGELSGRIVALAQAQDTAKTATQGTADAFEGLAASTDKASAAMKRYKDEAQKALAEEAGRVATVIELYETQTELLEERRQIQLDALRVEGDFAQAVRDSEQALKDAAKADREYLDGLKERADEGMMRSLNEFFARQRLVAGELNAALQDLIDSGVDRLAAQSIVTAQAMGTLDAQMRELAGDTEAGKAIIGAYKDGLISAEAAMTALEAVSARMGTATDELTDSLEAANDEWEKIIQNAVEAGGNMLLPGQQVITPERRNYWIALDAWRNAWKQFMDNMGPDPGPAPTPPAGSFANGGVVPGAIGSPQLALVHGGETILPTHKGGGMFGGVSVVVNVQGDVIGLDDLDTHILRTVRNGVMRGGFQGVIKRDF